MRISTQIAEVRTEIDALDTRLSTQIADLRTEQRTDIAGVRTGIAIPNPSPGPRPAPQPHAPFPATRRRPVVAAADDERAHGQVGDRSAFRRGRIGSSTPGGDGSTVHSATSCGGADRTREAAGE